MKELFTLLKPDFEFTDTRGSLTQLVHEGFAQVNVLCTNAGVTRGGHYHKCCREAFYVVSGRAVVTLSQAGQEETQTFGQGTFFLIHPSVMHSIFFPEDCVMVAMYDRCVEIENGEKDIYTN